MLRIKNLENISFDQISEAFNASFSDYFVPARVSADQLKDKFSSEGGRLDLSVGVFKEDKLVAFILHFINIENGIVINYNGGTGVIPEFRGKRLTSKMYDFILPILKENNVEKMVLEVLNKNNSALKIYQNTGFKIIRELNCFAGKLNGIVKNELEQSYKIVELKTLDWKRLQSFWGYPSAWANSISTMNQLTQQNLCIGINKNDSIVGYLIYNLKRKRIHQIAIDKKHRNKGLGSHLLKHLYDIEKENISMINIDSRTAYFMDLLTKRGLKNNINQYEMEFNLGLTNASE